MSSTNVCPECNERLVVEGGYYCLECWTRLSIRREMNQNNLTFRQARAKVRGASILRESKASPATVADELTKRCPKCQRVLRVKGSFYVSPRGQVHAYCWECRTKYNKQRGKKSNLSVGSQINESNVSLSGET